MPSRVRASQNAPLAKKTKTTGESVFFISPQTRSTLRENAFDYDELVSGSIIKAYVWLDGRPLARIDNDSTIYYYHVDHLGTPQAMTNAAGATVWKADYEPFGKVVVKVGTVQNNLRFPGQYFDRETGLHYNYFRSSYDPGTGRYGEADPIGLAGGLNLYGYANQNPIMFTDPLGLAAMPRPVPRPIPGSPGGTSGATGSDGVPLPGGRDRMERGRERERERDSCPKCDESTLRDIAERKKQWCKIPNQPRACLISDSPSELSRKRYHLDQCIQAREDEIMCKGGDLGHEISVNEYSLSRQFCDVLILNKARSGIIE